MWYNIQEGDMGERRSLFEMIFGKKKTEETTSELTRLQLLNEYIPIFTKFTGNAYASSVVRSAVDAVARNAAKLRPKHIREVNGNIMVLNSSLQQLLDTRPNKYMDTFTFLYRVVTELLLNNNSFVYVDIDPTTGQILGLYPISYENLELLETNNEVYCRFIFAGGAQITAPYSNIIHLRRFFWGHDFVSPNNSPLLPTLELTNTVNQGIINAIQNSASIRGILKFQQAMLKSEDIKRERDRFVSEYMSLSNQGGIAALDAKADFIPLENKPQIVDKDTMQFIQESIYQYFGVSEPIVKSNYTEEQWNSFYESTIEPLAIQMGLEFTSKLFTERELGFGNRIIFESERLSYANTSTKAQLISQLIGLSVLTVNEARQILNLPPVEGGDVRYQSLNFINANRAVEYQLSDTQTPQTQDITAQDTTQTKGGEQTNASNSEA